MKPVLITQRLVLQQPHGEIRDALDIRWAPFLKEAGLVPIPVPSSANPADFLTFVPEAAGLILSGGNDLSAVSSEPLSRLRDDFESRICAVVGPKPILGVCRGLQFLAHQAGFQPAAITGHAGTRHPVTGAFARAEVNSFHDYGLSGDVSGWEVLARSGDGAIEAIRKKRGAVMGIMWHPEREEQFHPEDIELFRTFFV